ncbi:MAG: hypothetical protein AW06_001883 [Candidatus Accumulibacter cognatus]|uniref:Uncharacterized protein n=1 Tax=Candidatus Accumulibacter cognatus TaxID=2954383 RepID=A0A080M9A0_9PROT|nr:MAG: hypothetical protein AW06_001883 [Candidatus Accumulibacter cognatus]
MRDKGTMPSQCWPFRQVCCSAIYTIFQFQGSTGPDLIGWGTPRWLIHPTRPSVSCSG